MQPRRSAVDQALRFSMFGHIVQCQTKQMLRRA